MIIIMKIWLVKVIIISRNNNDEYNEYNKLDNYNNDNDNQFDSNIEMNSNGITIKIKLIQLINQAITVATTSHWLAGI